ncbi:MAG: nuclear transport factor 2 family protein [Acidobacteria bacterium]|nr:nuclear transport factor 2 family protein [Acidobacteriota bacterium]
MKIYQTIIIALVALWFIGCGGAANAPQTVSPTDVLKTYIEASDRKDLAAVKQTFSKGTMKMYEDAAQKRQISIDEVIKDQFELASSAELKSKLELGKETIEGDTAMVEVKDNTTGNLERIPFVKEDGVWKVALDKFMEDLMNKMREEMNMPASNLTKPDGSNKSEVNK